MLQFSYMIVERRIRLKVSIRLTVFSSYEHFFFYKLSLTVHCRSIITKRLVN